MYGVEIVSLRLVIFTASLVAAMGFALCISIFSWNPYKDMDVKRGGTRAPAGLLAFDLAEPSNRAIPENTAVLDLDCVQQFMEKPLLAKVRLVRLKGQVCAVDPLADVTSSQILNRTNGYVATMFHLEENRFTSDYIELAKGPNQILMNLVNSKGENWQREFTVVRQQ